MRSTQEREQLRSIIGSPQWMTVKAVAIELCTKLKEEAEVKDTEWESMKSLLLADGGVKGVTRFLQEITKEATYEGES